MKIGDLLTEECRTYKRSPVAKKKTEKKVSTFESRIEDAIREILFECNNLQVDITGRRVSFELSTQKEVKFEKLKQLSDLLGTLQINFTGYENHGGGCESCGWGAAEDMANIVTWDVSVEFFDKMSAPVQG